QLDVMDSRLEPGSKSLTGGTYWLGTDDQGRDMLSAIFYGLRISLSVGVASTVLALMIGLTMGLVAAYVGGRVETLVMRIVDIQLSFLGLGLPITEPSLGLLIANGYQYLLSGKYWISFFPGVALLVTIVSINLVADQLRDVMNPRLQK